MLQNMQFALSGIMPAAVATGLLCSTCTIYAPDGALGSSGAPSGAFTVLVLDAIACMDAPQSEARIQADQARRMSEIESTGFRHVALAGYYYPTIFPLIEAGLQASIVDPGNGAPVTTLYNVRGAEPDSQCTQTRLKLEVVTV